MGCEVSEDMNHESYNSLKRIAAESPHAGEREAAKAALKRLDAKRKGPPHGQPVTDAFLDEVEISFDFNASGPKATAAMWSEFSRYMDFQFFPPKAHYPKHHTKIATT